MAIHRSMDNWMKPSNQRYDSNDRSTLQKLYPWICVEVGNIALLNVMFDLVCSYLHNYQVAPPPMIYFVFE